MNEYRKRFFGLLFIFIVLFLNISVFFKLGLSTFQEESISIPEGYKINIGKNYWYQGTFYNDADPTFEWTTAELQFVYIPDPTKTLEYAITDYENTETNTPNSTQITMINGTVNGADNMTINDDYYAKFYGNESLGHYPATYSFTDEIDGTTDTDICFVKACTSNSLSIVSEYEEHKKIMLFNYSGSHYWYNYWDSPQTTGTIEFWANQISGETNMRVRDGTGDFIVYINIEDTTIKFGYGDGDGGHTDANYNYGGGWIHIKFIFDCITDKWSGWANGTAVIINENFYNDITVDSVDRFNCYYGSSIEIYFDAIGYSWDTNYSIGDNLYYNYYLGSETFETYNQTYSGNYYGTESFDYNTEPKVYYGTYDFREEVGETGYDIDIIRNLYSGTHAEVIEEVDNHKSILNMSWESGYQYNKIEYQYISASSGFLEFWLKSDGATTHQLQLVDETGDTSIAMSVYSSFLRLYYNPYAGYDDFTIDTTNWVHVSFSFDYSTNKTSAWVNGSLAMNDRTFYPVGTYMKNIRWQINTADAGILCIDAIGYSWDTTSHSGLGYQANRNFNPYDIVPLLEQGYNLDYSFYTSINAESDISGHINVLHLNKHGDPSNSPMFNCSFEQKTTGTVEFWTSVNTTDKSPRIAIEQDGSDNEILLGFLNTGWFSFYNGTWNNLFLYSSDVWYHIQIEFNTASDWHLWVNGTSWDGGSGFTYRGTPSYFTNLKLYQYDQEPCSLYIDAVGFSWDSEYDIGDNINPHSKSIITELESGGWSSISLDIYTSIGISGEYNFHKKFLNLTDNTDEGNAYVYYLFGSGHSSGTVEFYMKSTGASKHTNLIIGDGGLDDSVHFALKDNFFQYNDGSWHSIVYASSDVWYNIQIEFDCSSNWNVNINGTNCGTYSFKGTPTEMDQFYVGMIYAQIDYSSYIDAISYSWEHSIDYNLHCNAEAMVDFYINIPFEYYDKELLQINVDSRHFSSILTNITFWIYNFTASEWVLISNTTETSETLHEYEEININGLSRLFSSNGSVRLRYYGYNCSYFTFNIDYIKIDIYFKTELSYQASLDLIGTWKYRFALDEGLGTEYNSTWTYINVVQFEPNIELISESEYYTDWEFLYTSQAQEKTYVYDEDFVNSSWNLCPSPDFFEKTYPNKDNYLLDNYTLSEDKFGYSGFSFNIHDPVNYPTDITWDGTYFWITEGFSDYAYKYYTNGTFSGEQHSVKQGVEGIVWNGSHFLELSGTTFEVYEYDENWTYTGNHWDVGAQSMAVRGIAWDGTYFYMTSNYDKVWRYYRNGTYTGYYFNVGENDATSGIVWDGTYFWTTCWDQNKVRKYTSSGTYTGYYIDVSSLNSALEGITWDGTNLWIIGGAPDMVYNFSQLFEISKIYNGIGYTYIQTNETETLKLNSQSLNLSLTEGDKIKVYFNTTSAKKIELILLNSDEELQSFQISQQGNTDFDDRDIILNVNGNFTVDQLQFKGVLDDTKNLFLKNLTIYYYNITVGTLEYKVDPDGYKQIFLEFPYEYSCNVYEQNVLVYSFNFTTKYTIQVVIYEVPKVKESYISLYDANNEYLDFNLFTTYANYTYDGESITNDRLSDNILSVDDDTIIKFRIYDSFDVLVKRYETYEETFIDITLNVYTLKIKNEASNYINYTLEKSSISKSGNIFPDEIIEFHISSGNYILNYTNYEDNSSHSYNFTLYQNQIITINTTYFDVHFSLFTYDGFGINYELVRFYINGKRKDFGFNTLQQDTNTLTVLDFFNQTLFNKEINLKQYSEYNIYVEVYTMTIFNNYSHPIKLKIERNDIEFEQIIESQFGMPYRMLPNVEYELYVYYLNGTLIESKDIELDENNKLVSFGFYEEEVPYNPEPLVFDFTMLMAFIVIICVGGWIIVISWAYMKKDRDKVPRKTRDLYKRKKWKSGTFRDDGI